MKALNDRGGVNGRKVNVTSTMTLPGADRSVAAAKKQVEARMCWHLWPELSSTHGPVIAEMRKAGVPVVTSFSAVLDALPRRRIFSTGVMFEVAGEAIGTLSQRIVPKGKLSA